MIRIINDNEERIRVKLESLFKIEEYDKGGLNQDTLINIKNILSDPEINDLLNKLQDPLYLKEFDYDKLAELKDNIESLYLNIDKLKENVDVETFFKDGYNLDIEELKRRYKRNKLYVEFPNLNFNRLLELYRNPPKQLATNYDDNKHIIIDDFIFRKYMIALIQMVFNHMDLLVCAVGAEGSGKSTHISQDMYMVYWILKEIQIIDYAFDIKEIWFNTLQKFRETEDKYFKMPFRIIGLDEGNELNKQDWKDDEVKTFFQRLRRERYNRRIKFI
jgi:hypothetical protein